MKYSRVDGGVHFALCAPPFCAFSCLFMYVFMYVLVLVLLDFVVGCAHTAYNRHNLLEIGTHSERTVSAEYLGEHGIPKDIARKPGDKWFVVPDLTRKQRRRGHRARGLLARMKRCSDKRL